MRVVTTLRLLTVLTRNRLFHEQLFIFVTQAPTATVRAIRPTEEHSIFIREQEHNSNFLSRGNILKFPPFRVTPHLMRG
jgi:hypothetical protein